jgi:hypothetical protein
MMKESRISGAIEVAAIIFVSFWGFQCERVMWFILRREYLRYSGSSKDFGPRGCYEV